jgi:lipoprotein LprG
MKQNHTFIRVLSLCAAAWLLLAGCGTAETAQQPTSVPTATPTPRERVEQVVQATQDAETFSFEMDFRGATVYADPQTQQYALLSVQGDVQRPDGALARIRVQRSGIIAEIRLVSLEGQLYTTNPITREWQCASSEALFDPAVLFDPQRGIAQLISEELDDVRLEGVEDLEDLDGPHYHLSGTMPGEPLRELSFELLGAGTVEADVWADVETLRASRIVLVDTATNPDNPSTWIMSLGDYGEDVNIRAPITCP